MILPGNSGPINATPKVKVKGCVGRGFQPKFTSNIF